MGCSKRPMEGSQGGLRANEVSTEIGRQTGGFGETERKMEW